MKEIDLVRRKKENVKPTKQKAKPVRPMFGFGKLIRRKIAEAMGIQIDPTGKKRRRPKL
jgi:hypothetical protein